jgi:hypothetical protein
MSEGRINGLGFYSGYPDERSEINELIKDLKFSLDLVLNQPWSSKDLAKLKEIAEKVIEQTIVMQRDASVFSVTHEILNRIRDKIQDFIIHPIDGLLKPSSTESNPKELWGAIESAFNGPWSIYQELNLLNSNTY